MRKFIIGAAIAALLFLIGAEIINHFLTPEEPPKPKYTQETLRQSIKDVQYLGSIEYYFAITVKHHQSSGYSLLPDELALFDYEAIVLMGFDMSNFSATLKNDTIYVTQVPEFSILSIDKRLTNQMTVSGFNRLEDVDHINMDSVAHTRFELMASYVDPVDFEEIYSKITLPPVVYKLDSLKQ